MKNINFKKILLILTTLIFALSIAFFGASCSNKVIENKVVLSLNKTQINLVIGSSEQLIPTYKNGGNEVVTYASSDDNIATVNRGGVVTANNVGQATITASYAGETATCTVTVTLGEFVPVLEMTAINNNQVTVSMIDEVNLAGTVSFNGKTFDDCVLSYQLSDDTFGEIADGKFTPSKTGEVTISVSATWRGVTGVTVDTLNLNIAVKIIDSVQFFVNGEMLDKVELYSLSSWGGVAFANSMPFELVAMINGNECVSTATITSGEQLVTLNNSVLTANKAGEGTIELTCNNGEKDFTSTLPFEVIRPLVEYSKPITNFSFIEDQFDVEEIFGLGATITDAYQDGVEKQVEGNAVIGLTSNNFEKTVSEIALYTENAGYILTVEGYTRVIDTAEELKEFLANAGPTKTVSGYTIITKDLTVSMQGVVGYNERFFVDGVFDGNGKTIRISMTDGWSFGMFGQMTSATVKNANIIITESAGKYDNSSSNKNAILAHTCKTSTFENLFVEIKGTVNNSVNTLYLVRENQAEATFKNVVVNVDDGILSENATIYGTDSSSTDVYVFTANLINVGSEKFKAYSSVANAVANGETFDALTNSKMWVFDAQRSSLVWKSSIDGMLTLIVGDEETSEVELGRQENVSVTASYLNDEVIPTLEIISGNDVVTIEGNIITTKNEIGTALVKATFDASGVIIERIITLSVGYDEYDGVILLSDINDTAHLPNGLTPIKVTDGDGVVYFENGAWDWSIISAPQSAEYITKKLYVETSESIYVVTTKIYMGVIANEEDLKYLMSANATYTSNLSSSIYSFSSINADAKVSRKGYFIMVSDVTFNGQPWSGTGNSRYFEEGVFDGNGYTLDATLTKGWAFGLFGNTHNVFIKDTNIKIHAINQKFSGNQNAQAVLGGCMRNTVISNCNVTLDATDTTTIEKLYITTEWAANRAVMINVAIYVADGILANNASTYGVANNWTIGGVTYDTANCYIFTNATLANNERYTSYTSVATAISSGVNFKPFTDTGLWTIANNNLVWTSSIKNNVEVLLDGEKLDQKTINVGESVIVTGNSSLGNLIPTLTIVEGNDIVSIEDNVITALSVAGTATITVSYDLAGETVTKTITVIVKNPSTEPEVFTGGKIMLSDINNTAHLPTGLTPITITDENGVVYYSNGAWDWSKISAPQTYEFATKTLLVETVEATYIVETEIYMGVIANENDLKYLLSADTAYISNLVVETLTSYKNDDGVTKPKVRTGYWIFVDDVTVNASTWAKMYNPRYFETGILDGNGHTLSITMNDSWSFGIFSRTYDVLIKNLRFDISITNSKVTANKNKQAIFADAPNKTMIVDCLINITAADTIATPVSELLLVTTYANNLGLKNCIINVGDGILAENAVIKTMAGNWVVHGTHIDVQNNYFFTSVNGVTANNSCVAKEVADVVDTEQWRYTFTELLKSDWWTYDATAKTLTWGLKTV